MLLTDSSATVCAVAPSCMYAHSHGSGHKRSDELQTRTRHHIRVLTPLPRSRFFLSFFFASLSLRTPLRLFASLPSRLLVSPSPAPVCMRVCFVCPSPCFFSFVLPPSFFPSLPPFPRLLSCACFCFCSLLS